MNLTLVLLFLLFIIFVTTFLISFLFKVHVLLKPDLSFCLVALLDFRTVLKMLLEFGGVNVGSLLIGTLDLALDIGAVRGTVLGVLDGWELASSVLSVDVELANEL